MVNFTGITGLRFGEVTALQVRDINALRSDVTVRRAWITDGNGKRVLSTTKPGKERTTALPPSVDRALGRLIAGRRPEDWVFPGRDGGALNDGWFRRHVLKPAVTAVGLTGVTFHCLRHTAASQLIRLGTPEITVSAILGHAFTQMMLDVYGHHDEGDQGLFMARYEADFQARTEQERNSAVAAS